MDKESRKESRKWFRKGNSLINKNEHQKAIECYNKPLDLNPDFADAWYKKADALSWLYKYQEAMECINQALKLKPNDVGTMILKSSVLHHIEHYQEAIECINEALKLSPNNHAALVMKSTTLIWTGKYREAQDILDKATELAPNNPTVWVTKGILYSFLLSYEKALEYTQKALELHPDNPLALHNAGWYLVVLGKFQEGLKYLDRAIMLNPGHSRVWHIKGMAYYKLGRYEEAVECYDKALAVPYTVYLDEVEQDKENALEKLQNIDPKTSLREEITKKFEEIKQQPSEAEFKPKFGAYKGSEPYIFVSYSHQDSNEVQAHMKWMHEHGFHIWYDQGIPFGSHWVEELVQALEKCKIFVVFITNNSVKSQFVNKEIVTAVNSKKYILPVFLEHAEIRKDWQFMFVDVQHIRCFEMEEEYYRKKVIEICREILN